MNMFSLRQDSPLHDQTRDGYHCFPCSIAAESAMGDLSSGSPLSVWWGRAKGQELPWLLDRWRSFPVYSFYLTFFYFRKSGLHVKNDNVNFNAT